MNDPAPLKPYLERFDRSFVEGDADLMASLVTDDVELYWHHQPTIVGKDAIFDAFDKVRLGPWLVGLAGFLGLHLVSAAKWRRQEPPSGSA